MTGRKWSVGAGAIIVASVAAMLVPAAATAAGIVSIGGGQITYTGNPGEADDIQFQRLSAPDADTIRVITFVGVFEEGPGGCTGTGTSVISCPGANGLTRAVANTADGNDAVGFSDLGFTGEANLGPGTDSGFVVDQARPFAVLIRGGAGADNLLGGNLGDQLEGEEDNDLFRGGLGADTMAGGGGIDTASYGDAGRTTGVTVTLDDQPNDGGTAPNEVDNVHSDVENVDGSSFGDTIVGNGAPNALLGLNGADSITGNGGVDSLRGGNDGDTLLARDGTAELVECGPGADSATTDAFDTTSDCETLDASDELQPDRDGDGVLAPLDCDDTNPAIRPGLEDIPGNGVDEDCSGGDAEPPAEPAPECAGREATITGTEAAEKLRGTRKRDVIVALGGDDAVKAGPGKDFVCGGEGNDKLAGGAAKDRLFGEGGRDDLSGGGGKGDVCNGGLKKDDAAKSCEKEKAV